MPARKFGEVNVEGLAGLMRAFAEIDKDLAQDLAFELEEAGEPARKHAETIIAREVSGVRQRPFYSKMRTGVNRKEGASYIMPKWRGTKDRARNRPNLAKLQQPRLERAVDEKYHEIEKGVERFLDKLADDFDRR